MRKLKLTFFSLIAFFFPLEAVADGCPVSVGDTVDFQHPKVPFATLSKISSDKDEFETKAEFETRLSKEAAGMKIPQYVLVGGRRLDSSKLEYDSETSTYIADRFSWNNTSGLWSHGLEATRLYDKNKLFSPYAEVVFEENKSNGTYEAENAFGASKLVKRQRTTLYGVFDEPDRERYDSDYKPIEHPPMWSLDEKDSYVKGFGSVSFAVPIELARQIRKEFYAGIYYTPKPPYVAKGRYFRSATYERPIDESVDIRTLIGDIQCVVIADKSGTVWKTVLTAY